MSVDYLAMLEQEAQKLSQELPSDEDLKNIAELAERQIRLENLITRLEDLTEKTKENLKIVSQKHLPNALTNIGLSEFRLEDGTKVSVTKKYYPGIKEEDRAEAYSWLVENGHDIIKNEVKVSFSKGQSAKAQEAFNALAELGFDPSKGESIHWQTFRAWAKEVSTKGLPVSDLINIHVVDESTVKRVK